METTEHADTRGLAEYLTSKGIPTSPGSLSNMRVRGIGPPYLKLGKGRNSRVVYNLAKVDEWLESHAIDPESEAA